MLMSISLDCGVLVKFGFEPLSGVGVWLVGLRMEEYAPTKPQAAVGNKGNGCVYYRMMESREPH